MTDNMADLVSDVIAGVVVCAAIYVLFWRSIMMYNKDWGTKSNMWEKMTPERLMKMLGEGFDVNLRNENGETPLMYVKNVEVARILIEAGADVNAVDNKGKSVLKYAKDSGDSEVYEWLAKMIGG